MVNIDPAKALAEIIAKTQNNSVSGLQFSQGVILEWNPTTFENSIEWRGITLHDAPVLSGTDALSYAVGDVVALLGWAPNGGASSWWIVGRLVLPGADNAAQAVQFLQEQLAREIALEIMAESLFSAEAAAAVGTQSTSFVSLTGGPVVSEVPVGSSGRMLITISGELAPGAWQSGGSGYSYAFMGYDISGPTSRTASLANTLYLAGQVSSANPGSPVAMAASRTFLETGLAPGTYQVEAQYRAQSGLDTDDAIFAGRVVTVQAF